VLGVGHEGRATAVNAQVAQKMGGEKQQKEEAGYGHQLLLADGGAKNPEHPGHWFLPSSLALFPESREAAKD